MVFVLLVSRILADVESGAVVMILLSFSLPHLNPTFSLTFYIVDQGNSFGQKLGRKESLSVPALDQFGNFNVLQNGFLR